MPGSIERGNFGKVESKEGGPESRGELGSSSCDDCDELFEMLGDLPEARKLNEALFEVFQNDRQAACSWMTTPNKYLGNETPRKLTRAWEFERVISALKKHKK